MITEERFNELVKAFFRALKKKTLLIIIDTASKNEKAVFSLVSFTGGKFENYSGMLKELGFKNYGKESDLFVTFCAGRFSLYILDNIGNALRGKGVKLSRSFYTDIQHQKAI